jgi:hypothetical protein
MGSSTTLGYFGPGSVALSGDFNEIVSLGEKSSRTSRPLRQMEAFQNSLEDCGLMDLGFFGPKFTWSNDRMGSGLTRERLDRATANAEWSQIFTVINVEVLPWVYSDHNHFLVSFSNHRDNVWPSRRQFRYEAS